MVALGMAGLVIGFVLGQRFSVFALLPIELTALIAATIIALSGQVTWFAALVGFLSFGVSAQISYAISLALPAVLRARST